MLLQPGIQLLEEQPGVAVRLAGQPLFDDLQILKRPEIGRRRCQMAA